MKELERWERKFAVGDDAAIRRFAANMGDFNLLHHNTEAARRNKLLGIIAPGMLPLGHVSAAIGNQVQETMVHQIVMKFNMPLYAGTMSTIECRLIRQRKISAEVGVVIDNGSNVVAEGTCELLLPRR